MTIAESASVVAFNNWAQSHGWDAPCDPTLSFVSETLTGLLAGWRTQAGKNAMPPRDATRARALKPFLGYVSMFERVADSGYLIRRMGTRIATVLGDLQGKSIEEALPPQIVQRWRGALDLTLAQGRPFRFISRVAYKGLDFLQAEVLLAPLADKGELPSLVLAGAAFRANVAWNVPAHAVLATSV